MKGRKLVSNCRVCGKKANVSKWWTKGKNGKIYYYIRFYHSSKNIHLWPTDDTFSEFSKIRKKSLDLYSTFEDYIVRKMESEKYSYTSFKKELERYYGASIHNVTFSRMINRAISSGIIDKVQGERRSYYTKVSDMELKREIKFNLLAINYDLTEEVCRASVFLEATNAGKTPLLRIPFFIPYGPIDSLGNLHFLAYGEMGKIPLSDLEIIISTSLETIISISLARTLKSEGREFMFLTYEIPAVDEMVKFVTPAKIDFLRMTVVVNKECNGKIIRILADGAKSSTIGFQDMCSYGDDQVCFLSELEGVSIGENIAVKIEK